MKSVKIWAITDCVLTESEIEYCTSSGIQVEITDEKAQEIRYGNKVYMFQGPMPNVKMYTFDSKGECMLRLRYGDKAIVMQMMVYDSQSMPFFHS